MRALLVSVGITLIAASGAFAASTATLAAPTHKLFVLDGRVWRCAGAACEARGEGRSQSMFRECARVARKLGPLTAYARDGLTLDAATLARCNREARVP